MSCLLCHSWILRFRTAPTALGAIFSIYKIIFRTGQPTERAYVLVDEAISPRVNIRIQQSYRKWNRLGSLRGNVESWNESSSYAFAKGYLHISIGYFEQRFQSLAIGSGSSMIDLGTWLTVWLEISWSWYLRADSVKRSCFFKCMYWKDGTVHW